MTVHHRPGLPKGVVPLFPLPGIILLPFGHLPLHIFEPRYLNMVEDALGRERVIAMVQPRKQVADPVPDDAPLYEIATLGRIVEFHDLDIDRFAITLEGLTRVRLNRINPPEPAQGYRTADFSIGEFEADLQPTQHPGGADRERLLALTRAYFHARDMEPDLEGAAEAPYDALVTSLAMSTPFQAGEKQALLECATNAERARMLISLFEMAVESGMDGGSTH